MYGERLRYLRIKKGYSQETLADMVNIGNKQIWRYENQETEPDGITVARIAKALDTSTDYLLGLTDDPSPAGTGSELSKRERVVIDAWRRGDVVAAIRGIVEDSEAKV